ncbi:hypothetical protein LIER_11029 [Lithospermum erythrorhizon]|uniref:Uncharacterized protein n=1 Tax=Lithospermum erythrorhizon TaxID=34254 RepID=A0AAV3PLF8_LITER
MDGMNEGGSITRPPVLDTTDEEYSDDGEELAQANSKALNSTFYNVDANMFKIMNQCTSAKEAWEILKEDESILSYNNTMKDIANEFFSLAEPMTEEKLVRKALRTQPLKFESKVTAIEEAQYLTKMKVDERMGSLITYEVKINGRIKSKKQNIALKSQIEDSKEASGIMPDC